MTQAARLWYLGGMTEFFQLTPEEWERFHLALENAPKRRPRRVKVARTLYRSTVREKQ